MMVFNHNNLPQACEWLSQGNLLAYPTEAVWGIGCNPFDETAVKQILAIKHRPMQKGMIVVTGEVSNIAPFLQALPLSTVQTIQASWLADEPQATTWLLPIPGDLSSQIPVWLTGGRETLAIRVIRHPLIAQLCDTIAKSDSTNPYGFLVSTSCNPSGLSPATDYKAAYQYFGDTIGYLIADTLRYTKPSQILDAITLQQVRA